MKILVCAKEVPDSEATIIMKKDGSGIGIEERYEISYFDQLAIEEAIRIKEKTGNAKVIVVSLSERRSIESLRNAIAMGADQAFLIEKKGLSFDHPLPVARVLASFAKKEGFDLILCGKKALDNENGCVGVIMAGLLGIPFVTRVGAIEIIEEKKALVTTERDGKRITYEVLLPALFTTEKGLNEPRYPSISAVMKAMTVEIPILDVGSLVDEKVLEMELKKVSVSFFEAPKRRPPVKIIEGNTAREKVLKLIEILKKNL